MAVGSVAAFMNPEIIVLAGWVVGGGDLVLDATTLNPADSLVMAD